jgi:hypothetical protein
VAVKIAEFAYLAMLAVLQIFKIILNAWLGSKRNSQTSDERISHET